MAGIRPLATHETVEPALPIGADGVTVALGVSSNRIPVKANNRCCLSYYVVEFEKEAEVAPVDSGIWTWAAGQRHAVGAVRQMSKARASWQGTPAVLFSKPPSPKPLSPREGSIVGEGEGMGEGETAPG